MKLNIKKSSRFTYLYAVKSYRDHNGKSTTKVVEKFGTVEGLREQLRGKDPIDWAKKRVEEMTLQEKSEKEEIHFTLKPSMSLKKDEQRSYNGGYLFLQKIYHDLGLDKICATISKKYKNEHDLNQILSMLLYTRVLFPGSITSLEDAQRFIEQPKMDIHHIYRALTLLSKESDMIQASVYKNSLKIDKCKSQVIYYDCTNYFFESEEEVGLRQYGASKEHRPNPIVQMVCSWIWKEYRWHSASTPAIPMSKLPSSLWKRNWKRILVFLRWLSVQTADCLLMKTARMIVSEKGFLLLFSR